MSDLPDIRVIQASLLRMLRDFDAFMLAHDITYSLAYGTLLGAVRHQGFIPWDDDVDIFITPEAFEKFLAVRDQLPPYFKLQRKEEDPGYKVPFPKLRDERCYVLEGNANDNGMYHGAFIDFFILDGYTADVIPIIEKVKRLRRFERIQKRFAYKSFAYNCMGPIKNIERLFNKATVKQLRSMTLGTVESPAVYTACPLYVADHCWTTEAFFPIERKYQFEDLILPGPHDAHAILSQSGYGDYMQLPPVEKRQTSHLTKFEIIQ